MRKLDLNEDEYFLIYHAISKTETYYQNKYLDTLMFRPDENPLEFKRTQKEYTDLCLKFSSFMKQFIDKNHETT